MKKKRGRKSGKSFSPTRQQTHLETARTIQKGSCFTCQSISVRCTFKFRSFMSLKWKKSWKEKSWKMQEHATDISNNKSGSVAKWIIHFAHQKNVSSGESRSEKKGHKTRIFRKEPKREHEIHVMQIKKHKILISNWRRNEGGRASKRKEESERKKNKVAALLAPILKIYFIQVLVKAVFIQEVSPSLMYDWGSPAAATSRRCFSLPPRHVLLCNFYF